MRPASDLDGQVAIVTGAGRGIGREIIRVLAGQGAIVVAASRTAAALDELAAASSAEGQHGTGAERPFLELTEEQWSETLAVNLTGCFLVGQAAARAMVAAGRPGRIVFVSATNALAAEPRVTDYDASKAGLHGLTRSMALALGPHRITVNAVAPGWVRTPLLEPFLSDDLVSGRQVVNPVGRIGEPVDIARAVAWLVHPSSSFVNGAVVVVDGGQSAMLPLPWTPGAAASS